MAVVAAIGAIVGAGAAIVGVVGASKARKSQRRLDEARATRENQQQVRRSRIAAGQVTQAGISSGAGLDSSGVIQGAEGAVQQARGNIAFVSSVNQIANRLASAKSLINFGAGLGQFGQAITATANAFGPRPA